MRDRALAGAEEAGLANVQVRDGEATRLPVSDAAVDIVISNGVLNLVPDKPAAVREIARVL
jgi:arsenite methyltransferase